MENGQRFNGHDGKADDASGQTLLFQPSPFGNLDAIVESDGRTVYFYLHEPSGAGRFGTRACWVRNLIPGPYVLNEEDMKQGRTPMLPRTYCVHPGERPLPDPEQLEVIWFEEGNGAALVEHGDDSEQILAVIPPWSGIDGFHGYALESAAESPLCWPLPDNPLLHERVMRSRDFWQEFRLTAGNNPFSKLQKSTLACYEKAIGVEGTYYSIDGGNFPPRGLILFERDETIIVLTVAMGLVPQPAVELFTDSPVQFRRIELGLIAGKATGHDLPSEEHQQAMVRQLSGLAAMPWQNWTWLGPGHSTAFDSMQHVHGPQTKSALLAYGGAMTNQSLERIKSGLVDAVRRTLQCTPDIKLPAFRDDPVNILWLAPLTDAEQAMLAN
ncbi:MAG: suppressor of fused domain protein [Planctomycetota bacterium]